MYGSNLFGSAMFGSKSVSSDMVAASASTSSASGSLGFATLALIADVSAVTNVTSSLVVLVSLGGSLAGGVSTAAIVRIVPRTINFYERTANQITSHFNTLADANSLVARYDNDLRGSPTEDLWCDVLIDFGSAEQHELGNRNNFRVVGNLSIRIINAVGEGLAAQLAAADLIAEEFRTENVGRISFGVPTIQKVGRVGDNNYVNVTCPFLVGKQAT